MTRLKFQRDYVNKRAYQSHTHQTPPRIGGLGGLTKRWGFFLLEMGGSGEPRKKPLAIALFLACLLTICASAHGDVNWRSDYGTAQHLAQTSGRPLLVDFTAAWCGPCQEMERTTFRDPAVQRLLARCVCVRVDIDRSPALAKRFSVQAIPRLLVVSPHDQRWMDTVGYRPAAALRNDLTQALAGKPVIEGDAPAGATEAPEVALLRAQVEGGRYNAWKAGHAAMAARACRLLVEQLAAFDTEPRQRAGELLVRLKADGVDALVAALDHPHLAVRVAAYDSLNRLLANRFHLPTASQPPYNAWAPAHERARMAHLWSQWWIQNRHLLGTSA